VAPGGAGFRREIEVRSTERHVQLLTRGGNVEPGEGVLLELRDRARGQA